MITSVLLLVLLITSPDYFNVDKSESGKAVSAIILATQIINIVVFLVIGILYDTLGRKPILAVGQVLTAVCLICMPYSGSVLPGLLLSRCGVAASTSAILGSPLIVDYIHNKSKGIALALLGFVGGMAIILVTVVELKLAQYYKLQVFFYPPSIICLLAAVALLFCIREPPETSSSEASSFCSSISEKCSLLSKQMKTREIWVAMACNFIVKALDVYTATLCTLWFSYNIFDQDTKATSAFMNKFLGAASVCTLFLTFFLGFLADRTNYRRLVPPIFFGIFLFVLVIYLAETMTSTLVTAFMGISSTLIMTTNPAVTWLLARNVRSSAKGTTFAMYHLSGAVGLLFFGITGSLLVNSSGGKEIFIFASMMALLGSLVSLSVWMRKD